MTTEDKIKEAFESEPFADEVWKGCGPTALDIYQAGYMACLNSLEYAATLPDNWKDKVAYFLPEGVAK